MAFRTVHPQIIKADSTILNPTNINWHTALNGNANDFRQINNGTATNVTYANDFGKVNQGAYFNGAAYILYNNSNDFALKANDFTISFWFRTSTTNFCCLIGQTGGSGFFYQSSWLMVMQGGKILPYLYVADSYRNLISTNTFNDGFWHFCAFTRRGDLYELLIDNNLEATSATNQSVWNGAYWNGGTENTAYPVPYKLAIGKAGEINSLFYTGYLDEVGLLNVGADRNLLTYMYNSGAGRTPPF